MATSTATNPTTVIWSGTQLAHSRSLASMYGLLVIAPIIVTRFLLFYIFLPLPAWQKALFQLFLRGESALYILQEHISGLDQEKNFVVR